MKKLLLILLCLPMIFSCGEKKEENDLTRDNLKGKVKEIIQVQHKYLSGSQAHLNPLKLEDIAKKVNLDISSISRAVKSKYIDTPQGILSLKSFFTSKIVKKSGKIVGADELKNTIIEISKKYEAIVNFIQTELKW